MRSFISSALLGFVAFTQTMASPVRSNGSIPLPNRLLHQFPNGTWVENIAVRPNGNLLVTTSTPDGSVFQVKEPWTDAPEVELVHNFDQWVDRLIGIGETTPDTYVVVGSRFYSTDAQSSQVERTFCAMELDFSRNPDQPVARLIAWMPEAALLQSVAALPWDRSTVLISDQYVLKPRQKQIDWTPAPGKVWRVDTHTGEYDLVMTNYSEFDTTYNHGPDTGINGIKIRGNQFYWANEDSGYIYRMEIDKTGVPVPPAEPEVVAFYDTYWNDFAFGPGDRDPIWAVGLNAIFAVSEEGQVVIVGGVGTSNNLTFPGPTATGFGRHPNDQHIVYITGNMLEIPTELLNAKIGGWVQAIDTTGFQF